MIKLVVAIAVEVVELLEQVAAQLFEQARSVVVQSLELELAVRLVYSKYQPVGKAVVAYQLATCHFESCLVEPCLVASYRVASCLVASCRAVGILACLV